MWSTALVYPFSPPSDQAFFGLWIGVYHLLPSHKLSSMLNFCFWVFFSYAMLWGFHTLLWVHSESKLYQRAWSFSSLLSLSLFFFLINPLGVPLLLSAQLNWFHLFLKCSFHFQFFHVLMTLLFSLDRGKYWSHV